MYSRENYVLGRAVPLSLCFDSKDEQDTMLMLTREEIEVIKERAGDLQKKGMDSEASVDDDTAQADGSGAQGQEVAGDDKGKLKMEQSINVLFQDFLDDRVVTDKSRVELIEWRGETPTYSQSHSLTGRGDNSHVQIREPPKEKLPTI